MENTIKKIELQECKDRFVAEKCINELLKKNKEIVMTPTELKCSVDFYCSVTTQNDIVVPFNLEVKERYKDSEQLRKYPNAELKEDKLNRMKAATCAGTKLFYMVLLNEEKCLLYDIDKIDWDKVEKRNWWIKRTQVDPNSDYVSTPTYFIPYSAATVSLDCSQYYTEYYK